MAYSIFNGVLCGGSAGIVIGGSFFRDSNPIKNLALGITAGMISMVSGSRFGDTGFYLATGLQLILIFAVANKINSSDKVLMQMREQASKNLANNQQKKGIILHHSRAGLITIDVSH